MNINLRLNMAKNSRDFETLILLSGDDNENVSEIAKERATSFGFFDNYNRVEDLIKKNFK